MSLSRSILTVVAALSAACAGAPPPLRKVPLEMSGRGAAAAYVEVRVAGEPMRLLVDTGARWSMLPAAVARARKLPRRPGPEDQFLGDAHGTRVPLVYLYDVPVQFAGERPGKIDFVELPGDAFGGLLAPEDLLRRGSVLVIDFPGRELRCEDEEPALARLRAAGPLHELGYSTCDLLSGAHRVVRVRVNGVEGPMAIDTGATHTALYRNHEAVESLRDARSRRSWAQGLASTGTVRAVDDVAVEFAGLSVRTPIGVLPGESHCGAGLLGADVLRHCVLVWGKSRLWISCRPPEPGAGPS